MLMHIIKPEYTCSQDTSVCLKANILLLSCHRSKPEYIITLFSVCINMWTNIRAIGQVGTYL